MDNNDIKTIVTTQEFARIHAHISGDGYLVRYKQVRSKKELLEHPRKNILRNKYGIRYVNMDDILVEQFIRDVKGLFNRKVVKLRRHEYEVAGKRIYDLLNNYGARKSDDWFIPAEIMNGIPQVKIAWLKAFFDDEGYVSKQGAFLSIVNERGIGQIQRLLGDLEICSKLYGPYHNKYENSLPFYRIRIIDLTEFKEKINFSNPEKKNILEKISGAAGKVNTRTPFN